MEFQNILGEKSPEKACRGRCGVALWCVMLSNAKHPLADHTLSTVIARLGTSRGNLTLSMSS